MFVIVRHGNTFEAGEPARRIGARTDLPLTPAGVAQAEALGRHFAQQGWHFGRALVSPLQRTRATAAAILAHQPATLRPEPCEWLREIDHGPDEDRPEAEVVARIGAQALAAWDREGTPPPGWIVDAPERLHAWQAFLTTASQPTLLVTSNGAARFALLALGLAPGGALKLATGAYGLIVREADGALRLAAWDVRP
jgi:probable phosphoglycerate mutase